MSDDRNLQLRVVNEWMEALNWAAKQPDEPGEASADTLKARLIFCEILQAALADLIRDSAADEDAILYGLIAFGQMLGLRAALTEQSFDSAMETCINAGNHMVAAMIATKQQRDEREKTTIISGAVH